MYLSRLKIWNYRKFSQHENNTPGIIVPFHRNFNLLVGENDSGKTAIIDAIKIVLGTTSSESISIDEDDFFIDENGNRSSTFSIECLFKGLSSREKGLFLEWLTFNEDGSLELRVILNAEKTYDFSKKKQIINKTIKAGTVGSEKTLDNEARILLNTTYLKPLRDADNELRSGRQSRFAQILKNLEEFNQDDSEAKDRVESAFNEANDVLEQFLKEPVIDKMKEIVKDFFIEGAVDREEYLPKATPKKMELLEILRKLDLSISEPSSGLGSSNLLFIAAELLLLNTRDFGANLALIEEIESHIHPQAQLRLIEYFTNDQELGQYILTTHSTVLAASTHLEHITLLHDNKAFPMGEDWTKLTSEDYAFLERFLDATKSNLFFATGVILVEGDAENLLLPTLSRAINKPLHKYGVSIVNIGSTAFNRYLPIFQRSEKNSELNINQLTLPVSVITDVDIKPYEYYVEETQAQNAIVLSEEKISSIKETLELEDNFDFTSLIGIYDKERDFKDKLMTYGIDPNTCIINSIIEDIKQDFNEQDIQNLIDRKITKLKDKYNTSENVYVSVSPTWSLEHCIAMSNLQPLLMESIVQVHYKSDRYRHMKIEEWNDIEDHGLRAYKIYKFMLDQKVSKAMVAQFLATKINENMSEISSNIRDDSYLNYIFQSIYHTTNS
ncbi:ATP-dependent endonuclease [Halobacillus sp. Marseille-P3879]|uniref:ATP-dependent nuclease n=1 Tax=Halobacillus sp. Marseille-P3879 TaxID=2045014 RepID=UPI000C79B22B|nr:AAA family ATPase [Halobacillus sp. Marseille-P3879]